MYFCTINTIHEILRVAFCLVVFNLYMILFDFIFVINLNKVGRYVFIRDVNNKFCNHNIIYMSVIRHVVEEFHTTDGIGAMLWKKIYAMCYAYKYNLLFKDKPFNWFLIHPSDNAEDERVYYDIFGHRKICIDCIINL